MSDTAKIADRLLAGLRPLAGMPVLTGAGVYAFALLPDATLPDVEPGEAGLLYVGKTDQSLDVRNHFLHADSGRSTLRRSLGAALRTELGLVVRPRGSGRSDRDMINYRFDDEGERRLTTWMGASLSACQVRVDGGVRAIEKDLIARLRPPLNLTDWPNPQKPAVTTARAACQELARARVR